MTAEPQQATNSPKTSALSDVTKTELDSAIATLQAHKVEWARLPIARKSAMLRECLRLVGVHAEEWVQITAKHKGIDPKSPRIGEEWTGGVWAQAITLRELARTLDTLADGKTPRFNRVRKRRNAQTVLDVFPHNLVYRLLLHGVHAEVWMQDSVTPQNLPDHVATFYKQSAPEGEVALVLGAGNVNSIPPMDMLEKLIHDGAVVLIKLNPVNDYLLPVMEKIYKPFIDAGFLRLTKGGVDVGAYLTDYDGIETIHMTGSARTHDAIVFGTGEEGAERKKNNTPRLNKPITSELGGVGPVIVVPGDWTDADFRFQAENIVTMKMQNGGFNCVAAQVLILPQGWDGSAKLLDAIRAVMKEQPTRKAYYPGADKRQQSAISANGTYEVFADDVARTLITDIDANDKDNHAFQNEFFCSVLAQTSLPAPSAAEFLQNAVKFCNETLDGTLGANLIVHPKTMRELGPKLEDAIDALNYGAIAINGWNALAYLIVQCPWGAAPGHTLNDVQSGIGVVHNTYLLEKTQKAVAYAPFYPFPRSLLQGKLTVLPRPPWFITNPQSHRVSRQFAYYTIDGKLTRLVPLFIHALRG